MLLRLARLTPLTFSNVLAGVVETAVRQADAFCTVDGDTVVQLARQTVVEEKSKQA